MLRREPIKSRKLQSRRRTRGIVERDNNDDDAGGDEASELSFVNEGQLLLVSKASIDELNQQMAAYIDDCLGGETKNLRFKEVCNTEDAPTNVQVDPLEFRPNLVLSGSLPNNEDNWQRLSPSAIRDLQC